MAAKKTKNQTNKAERVAKTKRVMLWGRQDLLARSVELFLSSRKEWEVLRVSNKHSVDGFIQEVKKAHPDVVIIYEGDCASDAELPTQLLQEFPGVKVITVSLESNSMEVYNKQQVWINEVNDLLSVVEN